MSKKKDDLLDPLAAFDESDEQPEGKKPKRERPKRGADGEKTGFRPLKAFGKKKSNKNNVVRIEELERRAELGEDISAEDVASMYIPMRRTKLFAKALLRLDRLRLFVVGALFVVALLFILSFMQEKMGNFTINLDRLELFRKGISMSADADFSDPTARLTASVVEDATNISIQDLPTDLHEVDGDHNGRNFMAYTYYVRNAGLEDVNYVVSLTLDKSAKGAERAVRVAVWRNGERTVYACPSASGQPEQGCENFVSDNVVCRYTVQNFLRGYVDKYTVVIWMEGDDPECLDDIVGGSVEFSMNIDAEDRTDLTLWQMFVQDLRSWLKGDQNINPSGVDAPDYYDAKSINWENRLNALQDETVVVQGDETETGSFTHGYNGDRISAEEKKAASAGG